jgi:ribosome-associated toxin RatA of RatAB toxin-antitoxin module
MPGASTSIVIDAAPKVIYDVIVDFENYSKFLPDVKKVVIKEKKAKHVIVSFELSVIKKIHYTISVAMVPNKKMSWTLVEGDLFKSNTGSWELEEVKKGQTKATYTVEIGFGFMVPSFVTNKLVGSNLPSMMKRFKERAESLA